ncbi:RNA polymerase sigma factor (sigma-70 family) [Actinokineospora baliensis]|uniref:sigma-70 family RNA polymerase sigma factor n=1 Tax=Actinokineospora baliensis TaxID=547056 RepID=UPI00195A5568|nr:sigma-70 family RNA polymerase sigma factor [Actinokineospora baliensis]MBM7771089.1 RNA polymerase sigma factor (sigma-70 family) [Actinokineospora baliensis]
MTGIHRPASGGRRDVDEGGSSTGACEDLALLQRLRTGDDAAFGELFSRHSDAVRRLALGLVNDRAEAEDLAAEAFFRVLQAVRRGSGPVDNVRGYLLIVTRRVAWEWNARKRDVPVSDEELSHRVGAGPDNTGQSTERTLITRAFTSLPERWRSVLWKVEVEGERPAVVAGNFGLSPNATAALARRARQGLRAAYLQAHLTVDRGSTGCRSVLEKLGAYTAGSIKGTERRKVRAHLSTCPSCTSMQAELQDVCSGLRAHAAFIAAPIAGVALWQQIGLVTSSTASVTSFGAFKGLLSTAKMQVTLAATSAAAVGVFGLALVPWGASVDQRAYADFEGTGPTELLISPDPTAAGGLAPAPTGDVVPTQRKRPDNPSGNSEQPGGDNNTQPTTTPRQEVPAAAQPPQAASQVVRVPTPAKAQPQTNTQAEKPNRTVQTNPAGQPKRPGRANLQQADYYDESLPVVYTQTAYERKWSIYDRYDVVTETRVTTKVNAAGQTTSVTRQVEYTRTRYPGSARGTRVESGSTVTVTGTPRRR